MAQGHFPSIYYLFLPHTNTVRTLQMENTFLETSGSFIVYKSEDFADRFLNACFQI